MYHHDMSSWLHSYISECKSFIRNETSQVSLIYITYVAASQLCKTNQITFLIAKYNEKRPFKINSVSLTQSKHGTIYRKFVEFMPETLSDFVLETMSQILYKKLCQIEPDSDSLSYITANHRKKELHRRAGVGAVPSQKLALRKNDIEKSDFESFGLSHLEHMLEDRCSNLYICITMIKEADICLWTFYRKQTSASVFLRQRTSAFVLFEGSRHLSLYF